jgi:hypothetical protein
MAESESTTPWWTNLVAVLLTALVMRMAQTMTLPGGAPDPNAPASLGALLTDTALFIPHALILFGILADMFTYQGAYSIPSLIGLLAIPLNKVLDFFWKGLAEVFGMVKNVAGMGRGGQAGGAVTDYKGCYVQGFEVDALKSVYSSQTLTVTTTILMYYILDLIMNKGILAATASIVMGVVLVLAQASSMSNSGCFDEMGFAGGLLASIANGTIIGGLSFGIVEAYFPERLPSKAISPIPRVSVSDLKVGENGKLVDPSGKAWSLLPDGTPVPDTCGAAGGFGGLTDGLDSTGRPATQGSCPGGAVTAK